MPLTNCVATSTAAVLISQRCRNCFKLEDIGSQVFPPPTWSHCPWNTSSPPSIGSAILDMQEFNLCFRRERHPPQAGRQQCKLARSERQFRVPMGNLQPPAHQ